jgi:hypothetical protein
VSVSTIGTPRDPAVHALEVAAPLAREEVEVSRGDSHAHAEDEEACVPGSEALLLPLPLRELLSNGDRQPGSLIVPTPVLVLRLQVQH